MHFKTIKSFSTEYPDTWSFLGSPEEAKSIPQEHKDQIYFLNQEASNYLRNYLNSSQMATGPVWDPFNRKYFKSIEAYPITENCGDDLKKWLHNKPIPFDRFVYIDNESTGQALTLTWKMIIKYWEGLFFADDLIIFDETLNWGLYYFHENKLFYGSEKIYK